MGDGHFSAGRCASDEGDQAGCCIVIRRCREAVARPCGLLFCLTLVKEGPRRVAAASKGDVAELGKEACKTGARQALSTPTSSVNPLSTLRKSLAGSWRELTQQLLHVPRCCALAVRLGRLQLQRSCGVPCQCCSDLALPLWLSCCPRAWGSGTAGPCCIVACGAKPTSLPVCHTACDAVQCTHPWHSRQIPSQAAGFGRWPWLSRCAGEEAKARTGAGQAQALQCAELSLVA